MPFEKFFLFSRNVFILGCSHTSTTKIRKYFESRALFWGDRPRFPRSLSWKSPGHLGGCGISQNAYWKPELSLLSQKQRNRKQREGYVPPSRVVFRWLKSSIACVCNRYGLLSIHHASGGTFEERTDKHLSRISDTRHKVNILGFH
jgi:hypothetical protein